MKEISINNKKKSVLIDILKGFAIFAVLLGHSIQYGSGNAFLSNGEYWNDPIMKAIYSFHMPLFIGICGYLFFFSVMKHGMKNSALSRAKRFLPIVSTWAILLCILDLCFGKSFTIKRIVVYFFTDFWFLWAIIVCSFGILIFENTGGYGRLFLSALFVLFCLFLPDYCGIGVYKFMFPYFAAAFYLAKKQMKIWENDVIGIVSIVCWILLLPFFSKEAYIYTTGLSIVGKNSWIRQIIIDVFRYAIGFCGTIAVVYCVQLTYTNIFIRTNGAHLLGDLLVYLGKRTLQIYILSTYIYDRLMPVVTYSFSLNYIVAIIESIIVCVVCLLLSAIIQKSRFLSKLLIGERNS